MVDRKEDRAILQAALVEEFAKLKEALMKVDAATPLHAKALVQETVEEDRQQQLVVDQLVVDLGALEDCLVLRELLERRDLEVLLQEVHLKEVVLQEVLWRICV